MSECYLQQEILQAMHHLRHLVTCFRLGALLVYCVGFNALLAQQGFIRSYSIRDGLVSNRIKGFHQDGEGFIWILTWEGLSRFEGYRFRNYYGGEHLKHGFINAVAEYPDGRMYIAENDGSIDLIQHERVESFLDSGKVVINTLLPDGSGDFIAFTDYRGVGRFAHGVYKGFANTTVVSVNDGVIAGDRIFVVGTYGAPSGVLDFDMQFVKTWNDQPDWIRGIFQDTSGDILVGTANGLMQVNLDKRSSRYLELDQAFLIPEDCPVYTSSIRDILQEDDGSYWFATDKGLLHLQDRSNWRLYTISDGLPTNDITRLFIDRDHLLWVATDLGIAVLDLRRRMDVFNQQSPFVRSDITGIYPTMDHAVYISTRIGQLYKITQDGRVIQIQREQQDDNFLIGIASVAGRQYEVTPTGIRPVLLDPPIVDPDQASVRYSNNAIARSGQVILTCHGGKLHRCTIAGHCIRDPDFGYPVSVILSHADTAFLGTWQDGLFRGEQLPDGSMRYQLEDFALPGKSIRSLLMDTRGDLWIGTRYNGVARIRHADQKVEVYDHNRGLISNWVSALAEDAEGNIWVGTGSGLDKLVAQGDTFRLFPASRVLDCYAAVAMISVDQMNTVWAGTNSGLYRIRDQGIDQIGPGEVYFTEITLGGEEVYLDQPVLSLAYSNNSAAFGFTMPQYWNPDELIFSYRLIGARDTTWTPPSNVHQVSYPNLAPGNYRFEVVSYGLNGVRGLPLAYAFSVRNPLWRQWWFQGALILVIAAILFLLYRFRLSQLRRLQAVRERIASDLHDDIGSSLTHVNILAEIGRRSTHVNGKTSELFDRIGEEVQSSAEALDDIIWSVQSRRDAIEDVIARMRRYAHELLEANQITFDFHEVVSDGQLLDMEFRRDAYLIYKELLRNVVRHAEATHVSIGLRITPRETWIKISDNGTGFDPDAPTGRSGIASVRNRVRRWHGHVVWKTAPDSGTEVELTMIA